ncbi:MAG: acyl-[acyl-carrier-protein]--UDP-N-acetylglucosamine O-acyltransferase, partial [Bacteroidetes bacterium]|nr:acyl-[acyl-carrier-protein]--UDP-N-acetylglucosamine O-acyltransferase [Bacteroidota bacterium]
DQIHHIQDIYRLLFVRGLNHSNAVAMVKEHIEESVEKSRILEFLSQTERGIMRGFRAL